ncbi:hypothetical protein ACN27J_26215 [Solwaraspora sp. WMMB762]|uniref:hypothetical protein n=1 Tax=Solwaraspora sp. WMMB762 TaxID=3404120 RepID=UPI003B92227C
MSTVAADADGNPNTTPVPANTNTAAPATTPTRTPRHREPTRGTRSNLVIETSFIEFDTAYYTNIILLLIDI